METASVDTKECQEDDKKWQDKITLEVVGGALEIPIMPVSGPSQGLIANYFGPREKHRFAFCQRLGVELGITTSKIRVTLPRLIGCKHRLLFNTDASFNSCACKDGEYGDPVTSTSSQRRLERWHDANHSHNDSEDSEMFGYVPSSTVVGIRFHTKGVTYKPCVASFARSKVKIKLERPRPC